MAALYTDFGSYPPPVRGQSQDQLREYAHYTIEDAWPQQQKGIPPRGGSQRISSISQTLFAFEPSKESEKLLQAEAAWQFNNLVEYRRSRLANVTTGQQLSLGGWWLFVRC